jgi:hypothetical protein
VTITGAGTPTTFLQSGGSGDLVVNSSVGSNSEPLSLYAVPIESDARRQISITFTDTEVRGYGVSGVAIHEALPEPAL